METLTAIAAALLGIVAVVCFGGAVISASVWVGLLLTRRPQGSYRRKLRRRFGFRANFAHRWAQWN